MAVNKSLYGKLDGAEVFAFDITNASGARVRIIEYGATVESLFVPDKNGDFADVLSGFDTLEGFVEHSNYQGMTVGPYCNRIGGAKFAIDGTVYELTPNEKGVTSLHSAGELSHRVWQGEACGNDAVVMRIERADGVGGYPGNIRAQVKFTLTDNNELKLEYSAVSDKKTCLNFTNHAYFNLDGYDGGEITGTFIRINADRYTPVDELSIPLGRLDNVGGTPLDLRQGAVIADGINEDFEQLKLVGGYDHNFCINGYDGTLREFVYCRSDKSGRTLTGYTTLPGAQLYTGNFLKGPTGKGGKPVAYRTGFCLETQFFPDTPNNPSFPQCTFDAGEEYKSVTVYKFGVTD